MIAVTLKFVYMWHNLPLENRCVNPNTLPENHFRFGKKSSEAGNGNFK